MGTRGRCPTEIFLLYTCCQMLHIILVTRLRNTVCKLWYLYIRVYTVVHIAWCGSCQMLLKYKNAHNSPAQIGQTLKGISHTFWWKVSLAPILFFFKRTLSYRASHFQTIRTFKGTLSRGSWSQMFPTLKGHSSGFFSWYNAVYFDRHSLGISTLPNSVYIL